METPHLDAIIEAVGRATAHANDPEKQVVADALTWAMAKRAEHARAELAALTRAASERDAMRALLKQTSDRLLGAQAAFEWLIDDYEHDHSDHGTEECTKCRLTEHADSIEKYLAKLDAAIAGLEKT